MQLDQHFIKVRERSWFDLSELTFQACRVCSPRLLVVFLLGALPLALVNFMIVPLVVDFLEEPGFTPRYMWIMAQLVFLEAPLATVPVTIYLGGVMFLQDPSKSFVLKKMVKHFWAIMFHQGLLRGSFIGILWIACMDDMLSGGYDFLLFLTTVVALLIRTFRPFLIELLVLEEVPTFRGSNSGGLWLMRRSSNLHSPSAGDLFATSLLNVPLAFLLTCCVMGVLWYFQGILMFTWNVNTTMLYVFWPIALWTTALYMSVFRFLHYIDLRIRREGWAVELQMRAEASRMNQLHQSTR